MTPKFGSGSPKKPQLPARGSAAPQEGSTRGLLKKEIGARPSARGEDPDKPLFGDIQEPLDEALAAVEAALVQAPGDRELHARRVKILRKQGDRVAMRAALQQAAHSCSDTFFGVKLAEALEEEGSYGKALAWRQWVAQSEPDDPDTVRRLAATASRAGELELAESSYEHLIQLRSEDEAPLGGTFFEEMLGKGLTVAQRHRLQQMGLRLLARALTTRDRSAPLLEAAARLAYRTKALEASAGFYTRALQTHPDHKSSDLWRVELLKVLALLGEQERWRELNADLIARLQGVTRETRGDQRAWNMLASQQIQAGHFEAAIATLKEALRADSKNAQAVWELGRLYVRMGRSQEAVDYYLDIINDPSEKKSVRRALERALADLYFRLGRYQEALGIYQREEEVNSRAIAPLLEAMGHGAEAEQLYQRSVAQAPKDARCHLGFAEYLARNSRWDEAAASATLGLRCTYATEEVHSNLAVALATAQMKTRQVEAALQTMEEICEAYPESIQQVFRKVKLLLLLTRQEEALTLAEEVRASARRQTGCAPSSSALWTLLGDTCSLLGRIQEAEEAYSASLRYDAMDAAAVRGLGILAEKGGDLGRALDLYSRFVVLDPLNLATPTIRQRLEGLRARVPASPAPPLQGLEERPSPPRQEDPAPPPRRAQSAFPGLPPTSYSQPRPQAEGREDWLGDGTLDDWYRPND